MKMLADLFTEEEHQQYKELEYPFNLYILHKALRARLEVEPDYEVWVPLVYYKIKNFIKNHRTPTNYRPYQTFISNRGKVRALRKGVWVDTKIVRREGDYASCSIKLGRNEYYPLAVHRCLMCSFVPVPPELGLHPNQLAVNHIDGDKANFDLPNLEWVTFAGNAQHASKSDLLKTKPVVGEVLKGPHKGLRFVLKGHGDMEDYGFNNSHIFQVLLGNLNHHRNCSWAEATSEDMRALPYGISKDIQASLKVENSRIKGNIEAKCIKSGETILITGGQKELIELGFYPQNVYTVIAGRVKSHKGYSFQRLD